MKTSVHLNGLVPLIEAAELTDVPKETIVWLIRSRQIVQAKHPRNTGVYVFRSDLVKIVESKLRPGPHDPTPDEILRRCQLVRTHRQEHSPQDRRTTLLRKQILELLISEPSLTVAQVCSVASIDEHQASRILSEMELRGLLASRPGMPRLYYLPGNSPDSEGMETSESILKRFRERSSRRTRRPSQIAA